MKNYLLPHNRTSQRHRDYWTSYSLGNLNEVAIIRSNAEKEASMRLGQAQAVRPKIVGEALSKIRENEDVSNILFQLLDLQATLKSEGKLILAGGQNAETPNLILNA